MNILFKKITVSVLALSMAGCAANRNGMAGGDDECSAAKSAGAGALVGALLGAAIDGKKGAIKGAAAGAVVGGLGCMAMNYRSQKIRSAQQVTDEYKQQNKTLPAEPVVTQYNLKAPKQAVRGNPVSVSSNLTLVDGEYEPVKRVEERLYIVSPDNKRKQIKSKEASSMDGGGQYANTFSFTPPEGVAEGKYRIESELYVNERLAKTSATTLMLAHGHHTLMLTQAD